MGRHLGVWGLALNSCQASDWPIVTSCLKGATSWFGVQEWSNRELQKPEDGVEEFHWESTVTGKPKTDRTIKVMQRTQVWASSPWILTSSIRNHRERILKESHILGCSVWRADRWKRQWQRLKFHCFQKLPCAAIRGWSSPHRAQHLSSNKSLCPLLSFPSLTCLLESRAQSSSAGRVSGGVGQESAFIEIVIVSPGSRVPLPIHLSSSPPFQAGFNRTRSLLLGSRGSALLFQRVSGSGTHHSYYSSGTNGRSTLWSMAFLLRHFHNTLDRVPFFFGPVPFLVMIHLFLPPLFLSKCHMNVESDW